MFFLVIVFIIIVNKDYELIGKTTEWGVKHYKYWVSPSNEKSKTLIFLLVNLFGPWRTLILFTVWLNK